MEYKRNEDYYPVTNKQITDEAQSKWEKSANLSLWKDRVVHIENDHIRLCTAVLLENQRLYNLNVGYDPERSELLYQIILNVFPHLIVHKLISVQPMVSPTDTVIKNNGIQVVKDENGKIVEDVHQIIDRVNGVDEIREEWTNTRFHFPLNKEEAIAKTRIVRLPYPMSLVNIGELCKTFKENIEKEILKDLWNNVGTIANHSDEQKDNWYNSGYVQGIPSLSGVIHRKTLSYNKYWIVINRSTYEKYKDHFDHYNIGSSYYSKHLYVVDHWQENGVLMGCYAEEFWRRGYIWSPYTLLSVMEQDEQLQVGVRYMKILPEESVKQYGKLLPKTE